MGEGMCWQEIKDISSAIQSFFVSGGVIVGGVWAYWLFYKQRQKYPRANLFHEISHKILPNDKILLQLQVKIENVGNVMISLTRCDIRVQKIVPLDDQVAQSIKGSDESLYIGENTRLDYEIHWPLIKDIVRECKDGLCEIEPNESDQFCYDFVLEPGIERVSVYTYFINKSVKKENELGWSLTTIYDFLPGGQNAK